MKEKLLAFTECTPGALVVVLVLAVANVAMAKFSPQLFGSYWKYVMWEGGVIENLTALNFLLGAGLFLAAAVSSPPGSRRKYWFFFFALVELVLAGEEINYGRGMIFLNLDDPQFATRYNPQSGTLHSWLLPEIPVFGFFVVVGVVRLCFHRLSLRKHIPIPVGFLNGVLLTGLALPFMPFRDARYLLVDEVFEWSGSVLLLCLALHAWRGWFFTAATGGTPGRDVI